MIIEIEKQVTSKEISERLCKFGVRQDSHFFWKNYSLDAYGWKDNSDFYLDDTSYDEDYDRANFSCEKYPTQAKQYAAYTVSELSILLLPNYCVVEKRYENGLINFRTSFNGEQVDCIQASEADAKGDALIYAIDKGWVKAEEL